MQRIYSRDAGSIKLTNGHISRQQPLLITICQNKTTQYKEKTYSRITFMKKMFQQQAICGYYIMAHKNQKGKNETQ
jgi:hypothetical protein